MAEEQQKEEEEREEVCEDKDNETEESKLEVTCSTVVP